MSPLATQLVETIQANGGEMAWDALVATVPAAQRQRVMNAVREGVKEGVLKRNQAHSPETGVTPLTVQYVGDSGE
ncbi:MAG TPA: hypothetical protein V6C65_08940 [Allocoleopsis sp.]